MLSCQRCNPCAFANAESESSGLKATATSKRLSAKNGLKFRTQRANKGRGIETTDHVEFDAVTSTKLAGRRASLGIKNYLIEEIPPAGHAVVIERGKSQDVKLSDSIDAVDETVSRSIGISETHKLYEAPKKDTKKKKKKKKKKRSSAHKSRRVTEHKRRPGGLLSMLKAFFVTLFDPEYGGLITYDHCAISSNRGVVSPGALSGAGDTGTVPFLDAAIGASNTFGPVCGPNGCF